MKPTAPENFDGDATTNRLDPTWKAQVDLIDPTPRSRQGSRHRGQWKLVCGSNV